ncbi:SDR family NAD(P)-dependent oxidoreductase [Streptomyces sp. NPDC050560]|uniref:SDR family NAD(P)-dependent oxidoreductase n=1 Tax=Streptomyces sp. NPDC050560 TaxID=3365630 RepID=UPI0037A25364
MIDLQGRAALVAGVGPNIGQRVATLLAQSGAAVVCVDRDRETAGRCAALVAAEGGKAVPVAGDVASPAGVSAIFEEVADRVGVVDALVNNAAVSVPRGILDTSYEDWQRVLSVALTGTFLMSQAFARALVAAGRPGSVVNVASTSGHRGRKNAVAYCSAKGGVLNLTRAMAMDLAPHRIRVNSVSPTKTGPALADDGTTTRDFSEIPLGRLGTPDDQAHAVRFLLSDEADFITGLDVRVDGGTLATWGTRSYASAR